MNTEESGAKKAAWGTIARGFRPNKCILSSLIVAQVVCFLCGFAGLSSAEDLIPIRLVSMLKLDDQGLEIGFPSYVFYDRKTSETYVVGSNGRITVYNAEFFPQISIGIGRGVYKPAGIFVTENGDLYICQGKTADKPSHIKVLNAAFFPVREITFADVPGLSAEFLPSRVAVAKNGRIYVVGQSFKGAVVFDKAGKFLHVIAPNDLVFGRKEVPSEKPESGDGGIVKGALAEEGGAGAGEGGDGNELNIPTELLPKKKVKRDEAEGRKKKVEVFITQITIDKKGRIYLTSMETSKTYIYDENEKFLFAFGEKGGSSAKLSRPFGVGVDVDREVMYVLDYMRHTVLVYGYKTGKFYFEFGGRGASALWFNFPNAIAVDRSGNVLISDTFNRRVQVIDVNMDARLQIMAESFPEMLEASKPTEPKKEVVKKKMDVPIEPLVASVAVAPFVMPAALAVPVPEKHDIHLQSAAARPISLAAINEQILVPPKPVLPVKQISPKKLKKVKQHKAASVIVAPKVVEKKAPSIEAKEIVVDLGKGRVIRLPAALGVYGPVMTIGLVGGWYLYGEVDALAK